jgi:hypothetical protein
MGPNVLLIGHRLLTNTNNSHVSLEFLYKLGDDAPKLEHVEKVSAGLAIKF